MKLFAVTGEYRPKPDSSAAALIEPMVRKFLLFMMFNIVDSIDYTSNYKGIFRIGIGECLVQIPEDSFGAVWAVYKKNKRPVGH